MFVNTHVSGIARHVCPEDFQPKIQPREIALTEMLEEPPR